MTTNVALTVATNSANIAAAEAAQRAREAKKIACESLVVNYQHNQATVEQQQQYADCISLLHPTSCDEGYIIGLKVIIVIALIGAIIGAYKGATDSLFDEIADKVIYIPMLMFVGAVLALAITAFFTLTIYGIWFLFAG